MAYLCYLLKSVSQPTQTYVGVTNDLPRRLRQHNGELSGGAKSTRRYRPWSTVLHVEGFETRGQALQFEWAVKHTSGKRRSLPASGGCGVDGRVSKVSTLVEKTNSDNMASDESSDDSKSGPLIIVWD